MTSSSSSRTRTLIGLMSAWTARATLSLGTSSGSSGVALRPLLAGGEDMSLTLSPTVQLVETGPRRWVRATLRGSSEKREKPSRTTVQGRLALLVDQTLSGIWTGRELRNCCTRGR